MTTKETCKVGFDELIEERGIKRRDFIKFCAGIAATLGLSQVAVPRIAEALEDTVIGVKSGKLAPAIWLEFASCTGCTESFAQAENPDIGTVVLDLVSLNYAETIGAGAGHSLELAKEQTVEAGGYLLIVEGAVMEGWDGNALYIGGEKSIDIIEHTAEKAAAIICAGSCAVDGGWQSAYPNPGGAIGVERYLQKAKAAGRISYEIPPIINVPLCPSNPEHLIAVLVDWLLLGRAPLLTAENKPALLFGQTIHDNCPRRGHFENGEFVRQFGSKEEEQHYCLYRMGCKGPQTRSNCPLVLWNRRSGWCIESGAPCIGCATTDPHRAGFNWVEMNTPFLGRLRNLNFSGLQINPSHIAYGVGAVVAAALVIHGFGMKMSGRTKGGAAFEPDRVYDLKNPQNALSTPADGRLSAEVQAEAALRHEQTDDTKNDDTNEVGGDN